MNTQARNRLILALGVWVLFFGIPNTYGQTGYLMTPVSGADGVFEAVMINGDTVYRSTGSPGSYERYMYFQTDVEIRSATAYVEVTYKDIGYGSLGLQYNATTGDYEWATARTGTYVQGTQGERTAVFELPHADFRDAQNLGTDLRVFSEPSLQKHIISATVYLEPPPTLLTENLFTPAPSFGINSHTVSTSVFHWYIPAAGQLSGPWQPTEGRANWTGQRDWWTFQVKQMMAANIDILYVHLFPGFEAERVNLFQALHDMRAEGYEVPKVAPFLDPLITWFERPNIDVSTAAGKDSLAAQYIRFYNQYFSVNTDAYAEDYLAKIDGRLILNTWHVLLNVDNIASLTRADLESRLQADLAAEHPVFDNGIYMVTTALNMPVFTFADEQVAQFEINEYHWPHTYNGLTTVQLKGGYWDQNVRTPGDFLPRDGGVPYAEAWAQIDETVDRVYIESWNEYDEGTGIYAADTGPPFILPGSNNANTDTWSDSNDPYEYIRTTAEGAARFNDTPEHDAAILRHTLPSTMLRGEVVTATVTVRNVGDARWSGAAGYLFGQTNPADPVFADAVLIDDGQDDIPAFGGIFRGRPKTFVLTLTAPDAPGSYATRWAMQQEGAGSFGEEVAVSIEVLGNAAPVVSTAIPDISLVAGGDPFTQDLNAVFTDPDGQSLTFSVESSDETVIAATLTNSTLTVTPLAVGQADVTVVADDGAGGTAQTAFEVSVPTGVSAEEHSVDLPTEYALEANYPNPFNPQTMIGFALPQASEVRLVVYDVLGREVARLLEGTLPGGWHEAVFDAARLPSGVYLYRLEADDFTQMRRMLLIK